MYGIKFVLYFLAAKVDDIFIGCKWLFSSLEYSLGVALETNPNEIRRTKTDEFLMIHQSLFPWTTSLEIRSRKIRRIFTELPFAPFNFLLFTFTPNFERKRNNLTKMSPCYPNVQKVAPKIKELIITLTLPDVRF